MIVWPGKKVKASHIALATGVRATHGAWAVRLGKKYWLLLPGNFVVVSYHGPSPGLLSLHPDITISYKIISFCSKLNVFKSN